MKPSKKSLLKLAGCFLVLVAVSFLIVVFFIYRHTQSFVQSATRVQGVVTRMIEKKDHDSDTVFYPVCTFQDAQGKSHEIESTVGSYPAPYKVGDPVNLLYPPGQPDHAIIESFIEIWFWVVFLGGFGLLDLLLGLGLLLAGIQRSHRPPSVNPTA